jgi:hypothetical protein
MRGENIFGVKIVNTGTCIVKIVNTGRVNVDSQEKRRGDPAGAGRHGEERGTKALARLAKKCEEIRYLRRKSLHRGANDQKPNAKYQRRIGRALSKLLGTGNGETGRNLKVAATSHDGADRGRLMIGHI